MNEQERMWVAFAMYFFGFDLLTIAIVCAVGWFVERMKQ